jgi:hypothetical protein
MCSSNSLLSHRLLTISWHKSVLRWRRHIRWTRVRRWSVADALNINWNLVYIRQTRTRGHQWGFPFSQFPSSCFEHLWRLMSIPRTWPWQDDCLDKVLFFSPLFYAQTASRNRISEWEVVSSTDGGYSDKFPSWFSSSRLINLSCIFSDCLYISH